MKSRKQKANYEKGKKNKTEAKEVGINWEDISKNVSKIKGNNLGKVPKKGILKKLVALVVILIPLGVWKLIDLIVYLVIYLIK